MCSARGLLLRRASLWPVALTTLGTFVAGIAAPGIAAAQGVAEHQASYSGHSVALGDWAPSGGIATPSDQETATRGLSQEPAPSAASTPHQVSAKNEGAVDSGGSRPTRTGHLSADNIATKASATGVGTDGQPLSTGDGSGDKGDDTKDPGGEVDTGSDDGQGPPVGGDKSGVTSKVLSVPQGTGSIQGMGESFSAQLSTGIATFSVPFALPKARGGVQPSLGLSYSSSGGFGRAGVGWSVGVPFIARQTDRGIPSYDDRDNWHPEQDHFVFNGGQELVPICVVDDAQRGCDSKLLVDADSGAEALPAWATGHQYFRPRVEGSFLRFFWSPDHLTWRVQDKSGATMELGVPLDGTGDTSALERNPDKENELYRWNLVRQYDMYGEAHPATGNPTPHNVVVYKYLQDGGTTFLSDIYDTPPVSIATTPVTDPLAYAHHTRLEWERRSDPTFSFRTGWRMEENLRLKTIDVTSKTFNGAGTGSRRLVRRYHLAYDAAYHPSLLQSVQVEGRCANSEDTAPAEGSDGAVAGEVGCQLLPPMTFDYTHVKLVGPNGAGPELAGYEGFNETVQDIAGSPPHSLDAAQTALFDINSDSLPDVLVTLPGRFGDGHGVFFNGPGGQQDAFSRANLITVSGVLGATANDIKLSNLNINPTDLDGDGIVNLLHMPRVRRYSTYTPEQSADGRWTWLGRVIETASGQDPKIDFGKDALETQIVDVNFDGLVDVVVSAGTELQTFLALGRYPGGDGQFGHAARTGEETAVIANEPIRTCVPESALPVRFSDRDIKLADMNGDGIVDILRLRRGGLQYWPGRGNGVWGTGDRSACPAGEFSLNSYLSMDHSPYYSDIPETILRLDDVNGDGLTDLVEVRFNEVDVWLNVDGHGWTERHIIQRTPASPTFASRVQLVDVNGSGTRDILWGNGDHYKYIDLAGGVRPWVLSHVDNGLGKTTDIEYSTSAQEMLAAERAGQPWAKKMPILAHVVTRVSESENITIAGRAPGNYTTEYSYRDPVFEGRQREFRGFSSARATRLGDDNSPTDITETHFLLGECADDEPADGIDPCSVENRWRDNGQEALKGLPVITEKFDEKGTYLSTSHKTYRLRHLYRGLDGRVVRHAFESAARNYLYDTGPFVAGSATETVVTVEKEDRSRGSTATAIVPELSLVVPVRSNNGTARIAASSVVDAFGNRLRAVADGCKTGCEVADETITNYTVAGRPAGDASGWLWRTTSSYVKGSVHTDTVRHTFTTYDAYGAPILAEAELVGTVALERSVASSLTQLAGVASVDIARFTTGTTQYDAFGNITRSTAPNGRCSAVRYDSDPVYQQLPTLELIYTAGCPADPNDTSKALATTAMYDRGFGLVTTATNMQSQATLASYDQFGRLRELKRPHPTTFGVLSPLPSVKIEYFLPADLGLTARYSIIHTSTQDGVNLTDAAYLEAYAYVDGFGRNIVSLSEADPTALDQGAWVVGSIEEYDNKSAVRRKYLPSFYNGDPKTFPFAAIPSSAYGRQLYDAFGRQLQTFDLDGTVTLESAYHALSTDLYDAADLEAGPHQGTYATTVKDGHGRALRSTERFHVGGVIEQRYVITQYLATGEPEVIRRRRGTDTASDVVRWLRYDSLGRVVLNAEPNTSLNFTTDPKTNPAPGSGRIKAWRYAYNNAGDLVGTSDARGCGENFFYDSAGRLATEDYAPCDTGSTPIGAAQEPYSLPSGDPALGIGAEVLYEYGDSLQSGRSSLPALATGFPSYGNALRVMAGLLIAVHDRGRTAWTTYDGRGRVTKRQVQVSTPSGGSAWNLRYANAAAGGGWFTKVYAYDAADREISASTGAIAPELTVGGLSSVFTQYSNRGTVKTVTSSYTMGGSATLVGGVERTADGLVHKLVYGDAAATATSFQYDSRRRVSSVQTYRGLPSQWLNTSSSTPGPDPNGSPSTFQLLLQDEEFGYDVVNNPTIVRDWRTPSEWPAGAKPVTKKIDYDDLYRVSKVAYQYAGGDDSWISPFAAEKDADLTNDDARRGIPSPHVQFAKRVREQSFQYDWLGNSSKTTDDVGGFYDRSLGTITNDSAGGKPYRLTSATSSGGTSAGSLDASYDAAGNLTALNVTRSGTCVGSASACPQASFQYQWDEVGRLVHAVRRDGGPAAAVVADLRYLYNAQDERVLKRAAVASAYTTTVYVFDSLELRNATFDGASVAYGRSAMTEVPYLFANGVRLARVVYDGNSAVPRVGGSAQHVFFELGDHLGSTSVVLDKATGELVERSTFQAYGGNESDYRPDRWKSFREDYRFTGKEEDVEVGLQYFGKRYLNPLLGRWISADPLTIHGLGGDLNAYAYVSGRALKNTDPLGLCPENTSCPEGSAEVMMDAPNLNTGQSVDWSAPVTEPQPQSIPYTGPTIDKTPEPEFDYGNLASELTGFELLRYPLEQAYNDAHTLITPSREITFPGQNGPVPFTPNNYEARIAAAGRLSFYALPVLKLGAGELGAAEAGVDSLHSTLESGAEVFHGDGFTRIGSDPVSVRVSQNVLRMPDFHDAIVHGTPGGFVVDGQLTGSGQIAEAIASNPSYGGGPVRLITCYGASCAQDVSNWLGAPVRAATTRVDVARALGSPPNAANGGAWINFLPE